MKEGVGKILRTATAATVIAGGATHVVALKEEMDVTNTLSNRSKIVVDIGNAQENLSGRMVVAPSLEFPDTAAFAFPQIPEFGLDPFRAVQNLESARIGAEEQGVNTEGIEDTLAEVKEYLLDAVLAGEEPAYTDDFAGDLINVSLDVTDTFHGLESKRIKWRFLRGIGESASILGSGLALWLADKYKRLAGQSQEKEKVTSKAIS